MGAFNSLWELISNCLTEEHQEQRHQEQQQSELMYSPLTCELCSETFSIPADWVRHIESHAEPAHCVPKKRKRYEVDIPIICKWVGQPAITFLFVIFHQQHESPSNNIAALRCDLCSMYFITPAEWVRHIQSTHTESELALSNNSAPKRVNRSARSMDAVSTDRHCSICKKSFPSYASMLIHKRTHTGKSTAINPS